MQLTEIAEASIGQLWAEASQTIWVSHDILENIDPWDAARYLEDEVSEKRLEQIQDGADLTAEEKRQVREQYLETLLSGEGDADSIPAVGVVRIHDKTNDETGYAILAAWGYSFSGVTQRILRVFRTARAAEEWLDRNGTRADL